MEQFRQIGEVVGSLNALMVFQNNLCNRKQCCLVVEMLSHAYTTIAEMMKINLKYKEKNSKWKIMEQPLKELLRVYKEGESYIQMCLDTKDFWAKSITLYHNSDCVQLHIHNLLICLPTALESIEMAGQIAGADQEDMQRKKTVYAFKYNKGLNDPRIFQLMFEHHYLVSHDFCTRMESVWAEDRVFILKNVRERGSALKITDALLPSSILVNSKDYRVRRRLGTGKQFKEIQWLGESFALCHFHVEAEALQKEISADISLSHPNIMHTLCGFFDEGKNECFLVMNLMHKDLSTYIKELCGSKKRVPFSVPVSVDLMEYLHLRKIPHGELNPSNILIRTRPNGTEGFLQAKIAGFGLDASVRRLTLSEPVDSGQMSYIWHAPEVLGQETTTEGSVEKYDVYSFGMVCFEILTGKVPFEDAHLQGDKMSRNIKAGERPLFPSHTPKFLTNLIKKCWHTEPGQRPSFSSICRMMRYTKRFLAMNPEYGQQEEAAPLPPLDFSEVEMAFVARFAAADKQQVVWQIPYEIFGYRVVERERETTESGSTGGEDTAALTLEEGRMRPVPSMDNVANKLSTSSKSLDIKKKPTGMVTGRMVRPPQSPVGRPVRMNSESKLVVASPKTRRRSGPCSD
ncbi:light-sensor Protein kinase-like [Salvia divinorum]|uniref:Light-sensor Protein kinase-like n=1 Tax=Salvia divinorum TaxID=28513 RepID=A0ABD1FVU5_SALDI